MKELLLHEIIRSHKMIYLEVFALLGLVWMFWQLYRAKQFTQFKRNLNEKTKLSVIEHINEELESERTELTPNNENHIEATLFYWTQYPVRILQYALNREILQVEKLKRDGQWRYCQHLIHVQQHLLNPTIPIDSKES